MIVMLMTGGARRVLDQALLEPGNWRSRTSIRSVTLARVGLDLGPRPW